jgi:hypothetical protein
LDKYKWLDCVDSEPFKAKSLESLVFFPNGKAALAVIDGVFYPIQQITSNDSIQLNPSGIGQMLQIEYRKIGLSKIDPSNGTFLDMNDGAQLGLLIYTPNVVPAFGLVKISRKQG